MMSPLNLIAMSGPLSAAAGEAVSPDMADAVVFLALFSAGVFLFLFLVVVIIYVSMWKIFKKVGRPGWAALVPFYNHVVVLETVRLPLWYVLLLFVPVVNLFIFAISLRRLAAVFGKGRWFTVGLFFLPFIFFPILAFGKAVYMNGYSEAGPISEATKWALIAGTLFFLIETLVFSSGFMRGYEEARHPAMQQMSDQQGEWGTDDTIPAGAMY